MLKKDFNATCAELSQNINDYLQKFHLHVGRSSVPLSSAAIECFQDDEQKKDLEKINRDIDEKLDRAEIDALRDYMEKQLKKLRKLTVSRRAGCDCMPCLVSAPWMTIRRTTRNGHRLRLFYVP